MNRLMPVQPLGRGAGHQVQWRVGVAETAQFCKEGLMKIFGVASPPHLAWHGSCRGSPTRSDLACILPTHGRGTWHGSCRWMAWPLAYAIVCSHEQVALVADFYTFSRPWRRLPPCSGMPWRALACSSGLGGGLAASGVRPDCPAGVRAVRLDVSPVARYMLPCSDMACRDGQTWHNLG